MSKKTEPKTKAKECGHCYCDLTGQPIRHSLNERDYETGEKKMYFFCSSPCVQAYVLPNMEESMMMLTIFSERVFENNSLSDTDLKQFKRYTNTSLILFKAIIHRPNREQLLRLHTKMQEILVDIMEKAVQDKIEDEMYRQLSETFKIHSQAMKTYIDIFTQ